LKKLKLNGFCQSQNGGSRIGNVTRNTHQDGEFYLIAILAIMVDHVTIDRCRLQFIDRKNDYQKKVESCETELNRNIQERK
jgi:hypothetical protein